MNTQDKYDKERLQRLGEMIFGNQYRKNENVRNENQNFYTTPTKT